MVGRVVTKALLVGVGEGVLAMAGLVSRLSVTEISLEDAAATAVISFTYLESLELQGETYKGGLIQVLDRINTFKCSASFCSCGTICTDVDPVPITPTVLPAKSTP
jgi:hypothetical protein